MSISTSSLVLFEIVQVFSLITFLPLWRLQTIYITDPFLLQELFAAERAGLIEKPKLQLVQVSAPRSYSFRSY